MGVIQQLGQFSGEPYSFTIAGDTPTPEEASRISQILEQQEAPLEEPLSNNTVVVLGLLQEKKPLSLTDLYLVLLSLPLISPSKT